MVQMAGTKPKPESILIQATTCLVSILLDFQRLLMDIFYQFNDMFEL